MPVQKPTTAKIWTKPEMQSTLKDLRKAGYFVTKVSAGHYTATLSKSSNVCVLEAIVGNNGYLVRYHTGLFQE